MVEVQEGPGVEEVWRRCKEWRRCGGGVEEVWGSEGVQV